MLDFIEYLNMPTWVAIALVGLLLVLQILGEILEFCGKTVPEGMKIRKYFARKKQERKTAQEVFETQKEVKQLLSEVNKHYNADNISMRDKWIETVNSRLDRHDESFNELSAKMDKNNADTLSLLINSQRKEIIDFASKIMDNKPVTREEFTRIFRLYEEYETIIKENGMKNGEVDINIGIIRDEYRERMNHHNFAENFRGYN